jgi:hypothetical protein
MKNKMYLAMAIGLVTCTMSTQANMKITESYAPTVNNKAYWVETNICSVVLRAPIEPNKTLQANTPIDQLSSLPAVCTSNLTGQNQVAGGVRSLIGVGHRITGLSHQVTALPSISTDGKVELLISALFSLEKPQVAQPSGVSR